MVRAIMRMHKPKKRAVSARNGCCIALRDASICFGVCCILKSSKHSNNPCVLWCGTLLCRCASRAREPEIQAVRCAVVTNGGRYGGRNLVRAWVGTPPTTNFAFRLSLVIVHIIPLVSIATSVTATVVPEPSEPWRTGGGYVTSPFFSRHPGQ